MSTRLAASAYRSAVFAARPGHGDEVGVLGHDAVLLAQADDLLDQLLVLAMQADLLEQVADLPGRPERGEELVRRPSPAPCGRSTSQVYFAGLPDRLPLMVIVCLPPSL